MWSAIILVVGMAMNGTLSNLIAGVQIAFTQPFRLEDAVVLEGEFGWIEEISTMYVQGFPDSSALFQTDEGPSRMLSHNPILAP